MKKYFVFLLTAVIFLSLCGCTGADNPKKTKSKEELLEMAVALPIDNLDEAVSKNIVVAEDRYADKLYTLYCCVVEIKKDYVVLDAGGDYIDFQAKFPEEVIKSIEKGMYINIVGEIKSLNENEDTDDKTRKKYYAELDQTVYFDNITYTTAEIKVIGKWLEVYRDDYRTYNIDFEEDFKDELNVEVHWHDNGSYLNYFTIDGVPFFAKDKIGIKSIEYTDKKIIQEIIWLGNADATYRKEYEETYSQATEDMNNQDYASAHYYFSKIKNYLDAEEKAEEMLKALLDDKEGTVLSEMQGYWHNGNEKNCSLIKIEGTTVYRKSHDEFNYSSSSFCELNDTVLTCNDGDLNWKLVGDKIIYTQYSSDGTEYTREYYRTDKEREEH